MEVLKLSVRAEVLKVIIAMRFPVTDDLRLAIIMEVPKVWEAPKEVEMRALGEEKAVVEAAEMILAVKVATVVEKQDMNPKAP
jgi:hypothetical protein